MNVCIKQEMNACVVARAKSQGLRGIVRTGVIGCQTCQTPRFDVSTVLMTSGRRLDGNDRQ
jgi:hypothetical protein